MSKARGLRAFSLHHCSKARWIASRRCDQHRHSVTRWRARQKAPTVSSGGRTEQLPMTTPVKTLKPGIKMLTGHTNASGGWSETTRESRHKRGYGTAWDKLRRSIMARDSGLCQPSRRHGIVAIATAVDHIVPKHRGGTDDETNLEAISHMVHAAKTNAERNGQAWDEDEWFSQQGRGGQMSGAPGQ